MLSQELKAQARLEEFWLRGAHLEGQARDAQVDKAGEDRVPNSWRTSRQERAGAIKTKEPAVQEAWDAGKGNGEKLRR